MNFPFTMDPTLTAVAIAYKNKHYIADQIMRKMPVSKLEFTYRIFDKGTFLTLPNTYAGRKGIPNEVELSFETATDTVKHYSLMDVIPTDDMKNAPDNYNPISKAVEFMTELLDLDREVRVSKLVFSPDNYVTENKKVLSGAEQFSDPASDPVGVICKSLNSCFIRPNTLVMGRDTFTTLAKHPKLVRAILPLTDGNGIVSESSLAQLFGVDNLYIGDAWHNSNKDPKSPKLVRAWGKHIAALYIDPYAGVNDRPTWGITAEYDNRLVYIFDDPMVGARGGKRVKVTESVKELVLAKDLGYLIQNAIA